VTWRWEAASGERRRNAILTIVEAHKAAASGSLNWLIFVETATFYFFRISSRPRTVETHAGNHAPWLAARPTLSAG
jgi:hypothetical protein